MRRTLILSAALGLFGAALGCHHTLHGICDCDNQLGKGTPTAPIAVPPGGAIPPAFVPVPAAPATQPEPIQAPRPGRTAAEPPSINTQADGAQN